METIEVSNGRVTRGRKRRREANERRRGELTETIRGSGDGEDGDDSRRYARRRGRAITKTETIGEDEDG